MTALLSAELVRLRTVRSTWVGWLGGLAIIAVLAALPLLDPISGPGAAARVLSNVHGLVGPVVYSIAIVSACAIGAEFKRGAAAMTYLVHPIRQRVTAAQMLVWGGQCGLFSAVAAVVVVALGLAVAHAGDVHLGLSMPELARIVAGAGFGGAVLGAAGVLAATVARQAIMAVAAVVSLNVVESILSTTVDGSGRYLPLSLTDSVMGLNHAMPGLAAMGLLLAYLIVFALAVRAWALPRDLT
jgi:ABC-2 type transport system permease protein